MKKIIFSLGLVTLLSVCAFAQTAPDDNTIRRQTSLFEEYYKNKDFNSALPFGHWMAVNAPTFRRTLWERLATSYSEVAAATENEELKQAYVDSVIWTLNLALGYRSDRAKVFLVQKGYNFETFKSNQDSAFEAYTRAINLGLEEIHYSIVLRVGRIHQNNERISEAIELYSTAKDFYDQAGDQEAASALLNELNAIASVDQLLEINIKTLAIETDPVKKEKLLWQNYRIYDQQLKEDDKALETAIEIEKIHPTASVYRAIGKSSFSMGKYNQAIDNYSKAAKTDESKEDYINIAQAYISLDRGQSAREFAQKALRIDPRLGKAYILIGQSYEAAVAKCVTEVRGGWAKIDFEDRIVYVLAMETYNRAKSIDPSSTNEANNRLRAVEQLTPQKSDYFFKKLKAGDKVEIKGSCYNWIKETVSVPNI